MGGQLLCSGRNNNVGVQVQLCAVRLWAAGDIVLSKIISVLPSPPHVQPLVYPPPQGGDRHLAHEKKEINRKSQASKKSFSWVILELVGREWCTVPPSPLGWGGTVAPGGGGGWTRGGEGTMHRSLILRVFLCAIWREGQPTMA